MLYVRYFRVVNGNKKGKRFREFKSFNNYEELEKERERLKKVNHADDIDFSQVLDTGEDELTDEQVKDLLYLAKREDTKAEQEENKQNTHAVRNLQFGEVQLQRQTDTFD